MNQQQEAELLKIQNPPMNGWCTHEKAVNLFNLIYDNKLTTCLEIGTFGGRSIVAISLGLKALGDGIVFGIDPWKVEACLEGTNAVENNQWWSQIDWNQIIASYFDKMQEFDVLGYMCHLRKHDTQCLKLFSNNYFDFVHFDSNHSEEVSCRTVNDWWPKIKSGAFIVMDDIDWSGQSKAMELLKSKGVKVIQEYDKYGVYKKK